MADISVDDVKKLARLSKISVSDDEAEKLKTDLRAILDYVEQLNQADTKGLDPTYQITGLKNIWRDDEIIDYGLTTADLLKNAPNQRDNSIKVPKVL